MSLWWRVSCEELGNEATESVLAPTDALAATAWAEGRGTNADAALLVDVVCEAGCTGLVVGIPSRFELRPRVVWRARKLG